jgi:hypothetical protein
MTSETQKTLSVIEKYKHCLTETKDVYIVDYLVTRIHEFEHYRVPSNYDRLWIENFLRF